MKSTISPLWAIVIVIVVLIGVGLFIYKGTDKQVQMTPMPSGGMHPAPVKR